MLVGRSRSCDSQFVSLSLTRFWYLLFYVVITTRLVVASDVLPTYVGNALLVDEPHIDSRRSSSSQKQVQQHTRYDDEDDIIYRGIESSTDRNRNVTSSRVLQDATNQLFNESIFINCGSMNDYVDQTGILWRADAYYSGGRSYIHPTNVSTFTNITIDNDVYRSFRTSSSKIPTKGAHFRYNIPVYNSTRQYTILLYFYELLYDSPGNRNITVWIEDTLVVNSLDIIQESRSVGNDGASDPVPLVIRSTGMTVFDGVINIRVSGGLFPALLSAISVQASELFDPILINAGGDSYTDSQGRIWKSDLEYVTGGFKYVVPAGTNIGETSDDGIYTTERFGDFKYEIPDLPDENYAITFHLAEVYWWAENQRVFDIYIEGLLAIKNIDIIKLGYGKNNRAVTLEYVQTVSDGTLNIEFAGVGIDSPKLSAIEINVRLPHLAHAVTNGPYRAVDMNNDNIQGVSVDGSSSHTHGPGLVLNDYLWKEGSTLLGKGAQTRLRLPVGNHTVTLYVRDSDGNDAFDTTTISILPFGYAQINALAPNQGSLLGNETVTIKGSGFGHSPSDVIVHFGEFNLTNTDVTIVDAKTIIVKAPSYSEGIPVPVSVTTPLGTSNPVSYTYVDVYPIAFESGKITDLYAPTTGLFGPDGRLYVGTANGKIIRYTLDDQYKTVVEYIESSIIQQKHDALKTRVILGLAFDPVDTQENPTLYVSHSFFFHGESKSSSYDAINGKVSAISGANLDVYVDIVTGLPVSDHDHGVNGLEFGDNGELYFQVGGNTNAGVPGELSGSRLQKENVLSSATLVAHLADPMFNGFLKYDKDDDGIVVEGYGVDVFASGQRNSFDITLHSNGFLYATDNGMNAFYGDVSVGCNPDTDQLPEHTEVDEINIVTKGAYYGHPNRMRGKSDPRQCKFRGPTEPSDGEYTAPITTGKSSINGIIEFQSNHFGGQMRRNLIVSKYMDGLYRVLLSSDGTKVISPVIPLVGTDSLDVTQAPDGTLLAIAYSTMTIWYHKPMQAPTTNLMIYSVFPRRGGEAGGNAFSIYGENMNKDGGAPTVTVGGKDCPVQSVTERKIVCILPGGSGTVDVTVTISPMATSTFVAGYRYVKGIP